MPRRFASDTSVPIERTKQEIESLVIARGGAGFSSGWKGNTSKIEFIIHDRHVRFVLPLPDPNDKEFTKRARHGRAPSPGVIRGRWEQECRSCWRALLLAIKAKLEAVDRKISVFDSEFFSFIVNPQTNRTYGEELLPQVESHYKGITTGQLRLGTGDSKESAE